MSGRQIRWAGQHWALNLWPFQSVNIPAGRHRILIVARGTLGRGGVLHPWRIQAEIVQLHYCCGRGQ